MRPRTILFFCCTFLTALAGACGGSTSTSGGAGGGGASSSTTTTTATGTSSSSGGCDPTTCPASGTACVIPTCGASDTCTTMNAAAETVCSDHGGTVCNGNGNCVACVQTADCPTPTTACVTATCTTNVCGTTNTQQGTACTDSDGKVCDGNGKCVQCLADADCTAPATCDTTTNTCSTASCTDGIKDGEETDVDCGGPECDAQMRTCADGKGCAIGGDCQSKVCAGDICQVPTCTDGEQNGEETDVDCGGPLCDGTGHTCAPGQKCQIPQDCMSMVCGNNKTCLAASCSDGLKDGFETGVDCGDNAQSGCPACPVGQGCKVNSDCAGMYCKANVCQMPTCQDGVQDGGESDVDCGAVCGPLKLCASGKHCGTNADCTSMVCNNGTCM
jgi:hypothetical protein